MAIVTSSNPVMIADAAAAALEGAANAPYVWLANGALRGTAEYFEQADAGNFTLSWSSDGRRLLARTDPLGLLPAFIYVRDHEVAVSTSIAQLIAQGARVTVDWVALAVFLRLGFFIGEGTPFRDLRDRVPLLYEGNGGALWNPGWLADRVTRELWRSGRTRDLARRVFNEHGAIDDDAVGAVSAVPLATRGFVA